MPMEKQYLSMEYTNAKEITHGTVGKHVSGRKTRSSKLKEQSFEMSRVDEIQFMEHQ